MLTKAHKELQERIRKDVESFLEKGGVITIVETGVGVDTDKVDEVLITAQEAVSKIRGASKKRVYAVYDPELFFKE